MTYNKTFQVKARIELIQSLKTVLNPVFDERVYSVVPPVTTAFPAVTILFPERGDRNDYLLKNGWQGLVIFKVMALSAATAIAKLDQAATALVGLTLPNYDVDITFEPPQEFPLEKITNGIVYTYACFTTISIYSK